MAGRNQLLDQVFTITENFIILIIFSCKQCHENDMQCTRTNIRPKKFLFIFLIYNIRRIARLFPRVHYALNLRDAARNELEKNMERRYDFRCRRKPKCSEKTCVGKYGPRTKFTYDSDSTGNRTRAALVKGTGTTAAPTRPPPTKSCLVVLHRPPLIF